MITLLLSKIGFGGCFVVQVNALDNLRPKEPEYSLLRIMWQLHLVLELELLVLSMSATRLSTLERKLNPAKKNKRKCLENFSELR